METRAFFPGGGFLLSLLLAGLLLLNSDLSFERGNSVGVQQDGGWIRLTLGEGQGRFHRIVRGDRLGDLLQREMPDRGVSLSESCAGQFLAAGIGVRLSTREDNREVSCAFLPLPERHRYLMGMPMDLNRAGREDLVLLPGIGNALASRIVESREKSKGFSSIEDLLAVPGIGRKILEKVGRHATVGQ